MHIKTKTNTELPQTMGNTINNRSARTESPLMDGQQPKPLGCLKAFYWRQNFILDPVAVKTHECLYHMGVL